jgi:hypothetical protein
MLKIDAAPILSRLLFNVKVQATALALRLRNIPKDFLRTLT